MIESSIYIFERKMNISIATEARMMRGRQFQTIYQLPRSSDFKIKQNQYPTDSCGLEGIQRKTISMMNQQSKWLMRRTLKVAHSGFAITMVSSHSPGAVQNAGLGPQIFPHSLGPGYPKEPLFLLESAPVLKISFWGPVSFMPASEVQPMMILENPFPLRHSIFGLLRKVDLR